MQNRSRKIKLSVSAIGILLLFASISSAGVLDISRIGTGAKGIAMGRAQVAASDIGAAFINPAILSEFETFAATSMYTNLSEDMTYQMAGTVFPIKEGVFGSFGVAYLGALTPSISLTSSEVRTGPTGTTDFGNKLLILNYGREISPILQFGAALKIFNKTFDSVQGGSAAGNNIDLGFKFYPKDNISAGLTLQNLLNTQLVWTSGAKEDITSNVKMGINFKPREEIDMLLDYDSNRNAHYGIEWKPRAFLALRGGLELIPINSRESLLNYSCGVGLDFANFQFDYAYYLDALLYSNSAHYFSISFGLPYKTVESHPIMPASLPLN